MKANTTHFGYQEVPTQEKSNRVKQVFESVSPHYDLMNDLMSLGLHRVWKKIAIDHCKARPGQTLLDLAGGSGDLTLGLLKAMKHQGQVYLADINPSMLKVARDKLIDQGILQSVEYIECDAESLPFSDNFFDSVIIGFGLRNVTHPEAALKNMYRVLKPGGKAVILEFSHVSSFLEPLYDFYSFKMLPQLGQWVTGDRNSYQYLVESIRKHPDQETLKKMMESVGFEACSFQNLTLGITAIHTGFKL